MNEETREQAQIGLSHLKEVVLNVLYQARLNNNSYISHIAT